MGQHHRVEFVAMQHHQAAPVGGVVEGGARISTPPKFMPVNWRTISS